MQQVNTIPSESDCKDNLVDCVHSCYAVEPVIQMCPLVVFIYRFHCASTTTMCPLSGLYTQVPLYINYYSVSLGWSLYTGSTIHQLLQRVPWVVFKYRFHCTSTTTACPLGGLMYRFHCTSTTTACPLGGLYVQVPLYINHYSVSLG